MNGPTTPRMHHSEMGINNPPGDDLPERSIMPAQEEVGVGEGSGGNTFFSAPATNLATESSRSFGLDEGLWTACTCTLDRF